MAQVGAGPSRGLGAQAAGEAQDLGWDAGGKRGRPSPETHPDLQALTAHLALALTSVYSGSEVPVGHRHSSTSSCPRCTSVPVVRWPLPVRSSQDSCTAAPVSLWGRSWASDGRLGGLRESLLGPLPWACTGHGYMDRPSGSAVGDGGSHGSRRARPWQHQTQQKSGW